jgi:hypothetical protein
MPTWVLRKSLDGERVGEPLPCASPNDVARVVGLLTLEEQTAFLLQENETAADIIDGERKIYRDHELVGYIHVLSTD